MSRGIFITATDTGVGKTIVTAILAMALQENGLRVGVMKPVESGCLQPDGRVIPQDAQFLWKSVGRTIPFSLVNQYALKEPIAPALAAEHEHVQVNVDHIHDCYEQQLNECDVVLVEGAGGLLAPLIDNLTMHDLAVSLGVPVLVVARNILGTINHTALSIRVAQQRSAVIGIILNATQPLSDEATQTNRASLQRWAGAPLLGEVPYLSSLEPERLKAVALSLEMDRLLIESQATPKKGLL